MSVIEKILSPDWEEKLMPFIESIEFERIMNTIKEEKARGIRVYPSTSDVFRAFNLCKPDNLKVIMCAQDPYHQPGTADGLAFSCGYTKKPQPSLRFIGSEIKKTTGGTSVEENEYDLGYLAKQGVLLINSSLTVREFNPNSHKGLWNKFMDYLFFDVINHSPHPIVYLLLGKEAKETFSKYMRITDYCVTARHPASAAYSGGSWSCEDIFNKTNKFLQSHGLEKINW